MKFTKLSLVAALLAGSSVFAIDNVKVSGDANLFYTTTDNGTANSKLFDKDSSAADASVNLNVTADLFKNDLVTISAGAGYTVLTTLGLENNLVSGVWGDAHNVTNLGTNGSSYGTKVDNASWVNEAWIAATVGKTTLKLGRMELDTPLAFTEKWTIEKNTFEGVVALNQDIPDTTLVGAWVGNGNGTEAFGAAPTALLSGAGLAAGGVVTTDAKFSTYGSDGAYAAGIINNSFKPLTIQGWYYNVAKVANAYWLQADLACQKIPGLLAGAQYTEISIDTSFSGLTSDLKNDAYALMLGYEMKDVATVKVSMSQTGNKTDASGTLSARVGYNTATAVGTAQSKLYTEAWWNYGKITQVDAKAYNVTVESPVNGLFDLGIYYTNVDQSQKWGNGDLTELTVTASKSYGPADITLAYINADVEDNNVLTKDKSDTIQAYVTVNF
ncbi:hypothetical protein [Sulfurimonas sp. C5]|uniref:hypothetical protein n=1 Tax=Sulfurimonas sp. C5 TaxID=3036947 RepID=UPI0024539995|nr:hypothetical protein [Sulfurimonas sp. C5]MDH4945209.1 hypothetical protein [Sulfurimonas sp. C5]